ncbi:MAG TPA: ABC transporter ATP-binding protein [Candidatus Eisenbacteria bacterium]|nr:ABC transporter ATP-binding protein [Candidatus Eisenbacteria bacterium]
MIRVQHLTKRYGAVVAVDDLSFEVERDETFALIGPNGAGKTTTLKMLLGLARPDQGRIAIGPDGLAPTEARARRRVGYVPQRVTFPPARTVAEVLGFFAELRGLSRESVARVLERVRLTAFAARRARELSGGYLQRLSLGQALLGDPDLLVLDEPTASLDPEAAWEFRTLVETLQHEGKTIVLCSHLLSEVERVADRVLILVDGQRAALERLDDLRARQADASSLALEVEGPASQAAAVLARAGLAPRVVGERDLSLENLDGHALQALETLRRERIGVRSFEIQRPTLEEIFLRVVRGEGRSVKP